MAAAARADVAVVVVGFDREDEGEFIGGSGDNADLGYLMPQVDDPDLVVDFERYVAEHHHDVPPELQRRPDAVRFSIGGDRSSLRLRATDVALLRAVVDANPRTVVVLVAGSAVVTSEWDASVPAILLGWYNGMEGGHALADLLLGAASPGGRLPFVVPVEEADLPPFDRDARTFTYDGLHGQWYLDANGCRAAYPFGFGLTYTRFEHAAERAELVGDEVVVRATTFNAGPRDGVDVVQVYVTRPAAPGRASRRLGCPSPGRGSTARHCPSPTTASTARSARGACVPSRIPPPRCRRSAGCCAPVAFWLSPTGTAAIPPLGR